MATLSDRNGSRAIQFPADGRRGKRRTITLGKIDRKSAETIRAHVDRLIVAKHFGQALAVDTAAWLTSISDELYAKLAKVGLVSVRPMAEAMEIDNVFTDFLKRRTDLKRYTRNVITQAHTYAVKFFTAKRDVRTITVGDAQDFKRYLTSRKLSPATVSGYIKKTRQVFADLKSRKAIDDNPFSAVKPGTQVNRARMFFVPAETVQTLIDSTNDREWKLLFALARWAGIRIPSEIDMLTWSDILWDQGKMIVHAPKTEHHEGKDRRTIPIFEEIYPLLLDCFQNAAEGQKYVLPSLRNRANLRRRTEQMLTRAGIKQWPKLFQNMRSSRETELVATIPLHVVCEWIGNSPKVAMDHYLQVRDSDFTAFSKSAVKSAAPRSRIQPNTTLEISETLGKTKDFDISDAPGGDKSNPGKLLENLKLSEQALQDLLRAAHRRFDVVDRRNLTRLARSVRRARGGSR